MVETRRAATAERKDRIWTPGLCGGVFVVNRWTGGDADQPLTHFFFFTEQLSMIGAGYTAPGLSFAMAATSLGQIERVLAGEHA